MERNRDGRRTAATAFQPGSRRSQVKDTSDFEGRLEEATDAQEDLRAWEGTKKERLTTFHVSAVFNHGNKSKRAVFLQEPHGLGRQGSSAQDADDSLEETEAEASEDDDEPPSQPPCRKPVMARSHSKEYERVKDIPAVPRKARSSMSSSSRFSSKSRREVEPHSTEISWQKSPVVTKTLPKETSSSGTPQKQGKKLKSSGPKVCPMRALKASEPSPISDQEVEVAEALFVLARSVPFHSGFVEKKSEVEVETESRTSSPPASCYSGPSSGLHPAGDAVNGYVSSHGKNNTGPFIEAPKPKRPRVVVKQEDGGVSAKFCLVASAVVSPSASASLLIQSSVREAEPDHLAGESQLPAADMSGVPLLKVKGSTEVSLSSLSQGHGGDRKVEPLHSESIEQDEYKALKPEMHSNSEMQVKRVKLASNVEVEGANIECDGLVNAEQASRLVDKFYEGDGGMPQPKIDLMLASDDGGPAFSGKHVVADNALIKSAGYNADAPADTVPKDGVRVTELVEDLLKPEGKSDKEEPDLKDVKEREGESSIALQSRSQKDDPDYGVASSFTFTTLSTAASSNPPVVAGWMSGLPPLGYYGPGARPWPAGSPIPTPGLDVKTANSAMQLPHGAILAPIPRMNRCAIHVYMAHFIRHEQQLSRHSLWSAALCRAAPYNLNMPPTGMLDNDKRGGHSMDATQKASAQQSGPAFACTISHASGPGVTVGAASTGVVSSLNQTSAVAAAVDGGAGTGIGAASVNAMAAQAQQYLAAMMQQNGFASFPFPFNGPPAHAAQFFNSPFFAPYLMLSLPHLQQSSNVLPVQKQQQALPHLSSSQSLLQLGPQSSSPPQQPQQQQLKQGGISAQHCGVLSEKESTVGSESLSTTESRLSAMQQTICGLGPSGLPNLNISPFPLMLTTTNSSAMPSPHASSSGLKQSGKGQQPFQSLGPASLPEQQPFVTQIANSATGPITNRHSAGLGSVGLPSFGPLMGAQCQNSKSSAQQQQSFGGFSQQFPRSSIKSPPVGGNYPEDTKSPLKQMGTPPLVSRVDMEVLSPSLQGSPTSGGGPSSAHLTGNGGCSLSSATSSDVRTCRQALSGQALPLQSQPTKQAMGRMKPASGTSLAPSPASRSVATCADRVLAGNLGKFLGAVLPLSGQVAVTSQSAKPSPDGTVKAGQRISTGPTQRPISASAMNKGQVQQGRGNQAGVPPTTPQLLPPVSSPMMSVGTILGSNSHSLSGPKGPVVSASKIPSNGKGAIPVVKQGPLAKKPLANGPAISAAVSQGQNMSVRPPATQQKNQAAVHAAQFSQQQSAITVNQQRVASKSQVYSQLQPQQGQYKQPFHQQSPYRPQPYIQQHQQSYVQPSPTPQHQQQQQQQQQQQPVPQHTPLPIPHHYQPPNSPQNAQIVPSQQSQMPQHLQSDSQVAHRQQPFLSAGPPQTSAANVGMSLSSPNLTLGTAVSGNRSASASPDGAALANLSKAVYTTGSSLLSAGMPEIVTSAHPSVSGQVNSPHSVSSPYLHSASIKAAEQKALLDGADMNHPSSSSQAAFASNPTIT